SGRRHAAQAAELEPQRATRTLPDREDFRNLEAQLRVAAHAMEGACKSNPPSQTYRHCLQPETNGQHRKPRKGLRRNTKGDGKHVPAITRRRADQLFFLFFFFPKKPPPPAHSFF